MSRKPAQIEITRTPLVKGKFYCAMCPPEDEPSWSKQFLVANIKLTAEKRAEDDVTFCNHIHLCPWHEHQLLEKLFENWHKRLKRQQADVKIAQNSGAPAWSLWRRTDDEDRNDADVVDAG